MYIKRKYLLALDKILYMITSFSHVSVDIQNLNNLMFLFFPIFVPKNLAVSFLTSDVHVLGI
jgi:hypothetical protein